MNMEKYENGTLWEAKWPLCHIALLQVLPGPKFCLLSYTDKAIHGGTCLNVITDPDGSGKWQYDYDELEERLENWLPLSSKLTAEAISL